MDKHERYRLIETLGEGQFAVVYKATDIETGQTVAVKKIKLGDRYQTADGINQTALREMKFLPEIHHDNIIQLLGVYGSNAKVNRNLFLVYEYMHTDLEQIIQCKSIMLSTPHLKAYMIMLLQGLVYLHDNWILHRDLKPNNLLINNDGVLKIGDFGLAKFFASPDKQMTHQVVTRWYRAPELLFGARKYGYNIDMWSVGCILAELLLRKPFLCADSDIGQLLKIFEVFGTPTEDNWPFVNTLPDFIEFKPIKPINLSTIFTASPDDEINLLSKLMTLNPNKRISAEDALTMPYFSRPPGPCPADKLPKLPTSIK
ncbi:hypothetical protein GJ496_010093 [Pomphorhynchus laevis]|nr:hypothetical protein GJ496_010093 [Pomphorhynchus laevis]